MSEAEEYQRGFRDGQKQAEPHTARLEAENATLREKVRLIGSAWDDWNNDAMLSTAEAGELLAKAIRAARESAPAVDAAEGTKK